MANRDDAFPTNDKDLYLAHAPSRRYDYQITCPSNSDFKKVMEQALEMMDTVKGVEALEVRDNGMVICRLHKGTIGIEADEKDRVWVKGGAALNYDECHQLCLACGEFDKKDTNIQVNVIPFKPRKKTD